MISVVSLSLICTLLMCTRIYGCMQSIEESDAFETARSVLNLEAGRLAGKAGSESEEEVARALSGIPRKHMFR
jgi:hypothetical protein